MTNDSKRTRQVHDLVQQNGNLAQLHERLAELTAPSAPRVAYQLRRFAARRSAQAAELREVLPAGAEAPRPSTISGSLQRVAAETRARVRRDTLSAVLAEAERGERRLRERYGRALRAQQGRPLTYLLRRHHAAVAGAEAELHAAREAREQPF